jgi:paraquat-inducible protein B
MSKRANPTLIGAFILVVMALIVVGVIALVPALTLGHRPVFVSYFEDSLNGLEPGAAVKFQGVPVGNVISIGVHIDPEGMSSLGPVRYRIDLRRLDAANRDFVDLENEEVLRAHVAGGLRAQLQIESIVTGLLFVNLGYLDDPPPVPPVAIADHPVIPTAPSPFQALEAEAYELSAAARRVLAVAADMLETLDAEEFGASLAAAADAVGRLADAPEIRAAFGAVPGATRQLTRTMTELQLLAERLTGAVDPLEAQVDATAAEALLVLQTMRETIEATRGAVTTDAGIGYRFEEALISLTRAAEAIQRFATSLEQDPSMLLRGRSPDE